MTPVNIAGIKSIDVQGDIAILETIDAYEYPLERGRTISTGEELTAVADIGRGTQVHRGRARETAFTDPDTGATLHTSTLTAESGVSGAGVINERGEVVGAYLGTLDDTGLIGSSRRAFKEQRTQQITQIDTAGAWEAQQRQGLHYRIAQAGIALHAGRQRELPNWTPETPVTQMLADIDTRDDLFYRSVTPIEDTLTHRSFDYTQTQEILRGDISRPNRPGSIVRYNVEREVYFGLEQEYPQAVYREGVFASNTLAHQLERNYMGEINNLSEGGSEFRIVQGKKIDQRGDEVVVQPEKVLHRFDAKELRSLIGEKPVEEALEGFTIGQLQLREEIPQPPTIPKRPKPEVAIPEVTTRPKSNIQKLVEQVLSPLPIRGEKIWHDYVNRVTEQTTAGGGTRNALDEAMKKEGLWSASAAPKLRKEFDKLNLQSRGKYNAEEYYRETQRRNP